MKITSRERNAIIQSLAAGVVPAIGLHHIQVGRRDEVGAIIKDLALVEQGSSTVRFIVGRFGSGKTFFLNLVRNVALKRKFVVIQADITTERRLHGSGGQARSLFSELMRNLSTQSRPEGGALPNLVERWIGDNRMLMEGRWDIIINVGHVVPHEVLGFANHNKNYFIGLAGKETICASHMAAASYGIENNLGALVTPVRACFNKAEEDYLGNLPDLYVQVVMARGPDGELVHTGLYVGDDVETYLAAARQSRQQNITILEKPLSKVVCVMQADEFASTWVANKAIRHAARTRVRVPLC